MPSNATRAEGIVMSGGEPLNTRTRPEPTTLAAAAERLRRPRNTLGVWAHRYRARKIGKVGREVYYEYGDLATIDACLHRGEPVPKTPEARDALRDQLRAAYQNAA